MNFENKVLKRKFRKEEEMTGGKLCVMRSTIIGNNYQILLG